MRRARFFLGVASAILIQAAPALAVATPTTQQDYRALPGPATRAAHEISRTPYGFGAHDARIPLRGWTAQLSVSDAWCRVIHVKGLPPDSYCHVDFIARYRDRAGSSGGAAICGADIDFRYARGSRTRLVATVPKASDTNCYPNPGSRKAFQDAKSFGAAPQYVFVGPPTGVSVADGERELSLLGAALGSRLGRSSLFSSGAEKSSPHRVNGFQAQLFYTDSKCDVTPFAYTFCVANFNAVYVSSTGTPAGSGQCVLGFPISRDPWSRQPKLIRPYGPADKAWCSPLPDAQQAQQLAGQVAPIALESANAPTPPAPAQSTAPPAEQNSTFPPPGTPGPPSTPIRSASTAAAHATVDFILPYGCTWPLSSNGYIVGYCTFYAGPTSSDFVGIRGYPYWFYDWYWLDTVNTWHFWTTTYPPQASGFGGTGFGGGGIGAFSNALNSF